MKKKPIIKAEHFAAIPERGAEVIETKTGEQLPVPAAHEEIVLKPKATKLIPGFSRYSVTEDGEFLNVLTFNTMQKETKGDVQKVRLTNDKGERVWVDCEKTFKDLFQPEIITNETKNKPAKVTEGAKLSKSQAIYLLFKSGKTEAEILASNSEYDKGHVKNTIKDYARNPDKYQKALKVQKLIEEQASV